MATLILTAQLIPYVIIIGSEIEIDWEKNDAKINSRHKGIDLIWQFGALIVSKIFSLKVFSANFLLLPIRQSFHPRKIPAIYGWWCHCDRIWSISLCYSYMKPYIWNPLLKGHHYYFWVTSRSNNYKDWSPSRVSVFGILQLWLTRTVCYSGNVYIHVCNMHEFVRNSSSRDSIELWQ